jgi:hypothetical protein
MLLKGHKNSNAIKATTTRRSFGLAGLDCWCANESVSNGQIAGTPSNSLMLQDKGQQPRFAESLVGGYLFNQHR